MTEITRLIERYREGEFTLDELADQLANREWSMPSRYAPPPPGISAEEHALEQLGTFPETGTWEEVRSAELTGRLSREEYLFIRERRAGGNR